MIPPPPPFKPSPTREKHSSEQEKARWKWLCFVVPTSEKDQTACSMKGQSKGGFRQEEEEGLVQTGSMKALTELEGQDLYS